MIAKAPEVFRRLSATGGILPILRRSGGAVLFGAAPAEPKRRPHGEEGGLVELDAVVME